MPDRHRFVTICFSHYVERARWALDRFGVAYDEEPHMPFMHAPAVWRVHKGRAGKADATSGRLSTPLLVTPDKTVIADSRKILEYVDAHFAPEGARLYDDDALVEEELHWHDRLATHSRRVAYGLCFAEPHILKEIATRNVGGREAKMFNGGLAFVEFAMKRYLRIDADAVARSKDICRREMDAVAERLADGRPYLTGDRFTGWDLSLASFLSPLVLPEQYGAWLPGEDDVGDDTRGFVEAQREHPAGQWALRMFEQHRQERVVPAADAA